MIRTKHGLALRIYLVLGLLAFSALGISAVAWYAVGVYQNKVLAIENAAERALYGEKANSLIMGIVAESRSLFMPRSPAETESVAQGLLKSTAALDDLIRRWETAVPAGRRGAFADIRAAVADFIAVRTQVADIARTRGADAAREFGENPANRTSRTALTARIDELIPERPSRPYKRMAVRGLGEDLWTRLREALR